MKRIARFFIALITVLMFITGPAYAETINPKVTITPVNGTRVTEFGMFNIAVKPEKPTDQLVEIQYIVSVEGQPHGHFVSFAYIGSLPVGVGLPSSIFYSSCDGVKANRNGKSLTVTVTGGAPSIFEVSKTFTKNLWPEGSCDLGN